MRPLAQEADILLFSFDRPLQLYACLESIERYFTGVRRLSVIYRTSHDGYLKGYQQVKERFPQVTFIKQSEDHPKKEFKSLVLKSIFDSPSQYILFGVDDIIVKDFVDFKFCMEMMERTKAYGFYLRFGKNISFCYQNKKSKKFREVCLFQKMCMLGIFKRGSMTGDSPILSI